MKAALDEMIIEDWKSMSKSEKEFCFEAYEDQLKSGANAGLLEGRWDWRNPHEMGFILRAGENCFVVGDKFRKLLRLLLGISRRV